MGCLNCFLGIYFRNQSLFICCCQCRSLWISQSHLSTSSPDFSGYLQPFLSSSHSHFTERVKRTIKAFEGVRGSPCPALLLVKHSQARTLQGHKVDDYQVTFVWPWISLDIYAWPPQPGLEKERRCPRGQGVQRRHIKWQTRREERQRNSQFSLLCSSAFL